MPLSQTWSYTITHIRSYVMTWSYTITHIRSYVMTYVS
ncbi:hypothetical protein F383_32229 [Gossypium arboreum]|uniref:Uncharacterized protein n=1 Tax=Gossypium arboreum TaxID=29729 RepID=A0A0B0MYK6_GOSAR|nr:hypothetical protein F383_32229 [Gossypium arboreum]